jgi:hypothetical protein
MQIQPLIINLCQLSKAINIIMNLCGMADIQNVFRWMKQLKE